MFTTVWLPIGSELSTFNRSEESGASEMFGAEGFQKDPSPTEKNNDPAGTFLASSSWPVCGLRMTDA